ncbi:syntaxin-61-like isoform X3 [Ananas comosus]|uniref:Syntaxin-61-like isoform X3 n=1 Tax=Ananas comosus TaxID=4615 RepID=A0A6P5GKL8_ANACO|nr:syntaxin-61-like isoform X3 [Ananas comosus]XP_020105840.1 syntaxin-61-like isoform X3 [Ananas comosus]XP_020105841.1 syntaxin-61-like isoform X3 [Ananas comosus]
MDELDKAIAVAARDPAYYGLDEVELGKWRNWTSTAHNQVRTVRRNVEAGKEKSSLITGSRQDLTGLPRGHDSQAGRSNRYGAEDNDDFFSSKSDRQLFLIKAFRRMGEVDSQSAQGFGTPREHERALYALHGASCWRVGEGVGPCRYPRGARHTNEYVICNGCKSPDTILSKENRLFFLRCEQVSSLPWDLHERAGRGMEEGGGRRPCQGKHHLLPIMACWPGF